MWIPKMKSLIKCGIKNQKLLTKLYDFRRFSQKRAISARAISGPFFSTVEDMEKLGQYAEFRI